MKMAPEGPFTPHPVHTQGPASRVGTNYMIMVDDALDAATALESHPEPNE